MSAAPMIRVLRPGAEVEAFLARARAADRVVHYVTARPTKRQTIDAFARALDFPPWHGHNLDALADSLGDWAINRPQQQDLVVDRLQCLADEDPAAAAGIREVLVDLAAAHPRIRVAVVEG